MLVVYLIITIFVQWIKKKAMVVVMMPMMVW